MQLSYKVHEMEKAEGSDVTVITRVNPYLRLAHQSEPPLFIQAGKVFDAGGDEQKKIPSWFWKELEGVTDKALAEAGYQRPEKVKEAAVHKKHKKKRKKRMKKHTKLDSVEPEPTGEENGND